MASTKTRTKTIRLANETADYFENVPLNRVAESVHALLEKGTLTFDGEKIKITGGTPNNDTYSANLDGMAGCFGLSGKELLGSVVSGLETGDLTVENGRLVGAEEQWVSDFRDACHDKGVPCERVAEKAIQSIKRGLL